MVLSEVDTGKCSVILKVNGGKDFRRRLTEMGFVKGQRVRVIKNAPLLDPVEYSIMGYHVSLRRSEASLIEVGQEETAGERHQIRKHLYRNRKREAVTIPGCQEIRVALVGNPNCGKTSIFNQLTRSFEHVGNYSGVTVDVKHGQTGYEGYQIHLYDLPGTYSLNTTSPEEQYTLKFLYENPPDLILNVVDSTNLERNLYLTTQLLETDIPMVISLNMFDELKAMGSRFDFRSLSDMLGVPIIPTIGMKGRGLGRLLEAMVQKFREIDSEKRSIRIHYGQDIETSITRIEKELSKISTKTGLPLRYHSIRLLEGLNGFHPVEKKDQTDGLQDLYISLEKEQKAIESIFSDDPSSVIAEMRYGYIRGALLETYKPAEKDNFHRTNRIDHILTHRIYGIPVFLGLLWLIFGLTFTLGKYPTGWIESGISMLSGFVSGIIPESDFRSLLVDGVIGGVGGVLVFLPNILILFFFLSFLEDTGYMARAAFIMDKVMHRIGLHGKSFIPLVMGFGCNVPAILSTRIIESRKNRLVTMLILPFMSCSARLPVFILIISALFPGHHGTWLFIVYLLGILLATGTALMFRKVLFNKEDSPFVMELPPYRMPTLKNTSRHMWHKASEYLKKIGSVILLASVIIWGLGYYPSGYNNSSRGLNPDTPEMNSEADSYLERIGRSIQPVMDPLGFDWKMTVGLLAGVAGKEIVVSTLAVMYHEKEGTTTGLAERIKAEKETEAIASGNPHFPFLVGLSYILFVLVYFPCIAVVATVARESGHIRWAFFMVAYTTLLAYFLSFIVYNAGKLIMLQ